MTQPAGSSRLLSATNDLQPISSRLPWLRGFELIGTEGRFLIRNVTSRASGSLLNMAALLLDWWPNLDDLKPVAVSIDHRVECLAGRILTVLHDASSFECQIDPSGHLAILKLEGATRLRPLLAVVHKRAYEGGRVIGSQGESYGDSLVRSRVFVSKTT